MDARKWSSSRCRAPSSPTATRPTRRSSTTGCRVLDLLLARSVCAVARAHQRRPSRPRRPPSPKSLAPHRPPWPCFDPRRSRRPAHAWIPSPCAALALSQSFAPSSAAISSVSALTAPCICAAQIPRHELDEQLVRRGPLQRFGPSLPQLTQGPAQLLLTAADLAQLPREAQPAQVPVPKL